MLRSLFQAIFGSFSRKAAQEARRIGDHDMIMRMIVQANAIARGEEISNPSGFTLPKPIIPERRKVAR
jgi:hypothetical protein